MISSIFQVCQDQISWEAQTNFQCFNQILFGDGVHHSGKLLCRTHLRRHQSGEIQRKRGIQKNSPIWVMCFLFLFKKYLIKFLTIVPHAFVLIFPPFPKFNWVGGSLVPPPKKMGASLQNHPQKLRKIEVIFGTKMTNKHGVYWDIQ